MKTFAFVTQSMGKLEEAERILGVKLEHCHIDLPEIQAIQVEDVVTYKAKTAYKELQKPVMIEDTGLFITAWNGLPGALIKWFVTSVGVEGICQMLQNFPERSAWAKTIIATYDGQAEPCMFIGTVKGHIASTPQGEGGFGWDSVFIAQGATKTFGEMPPHEKDFYSMRRQALENMLAYYS